MAVGLKARLQQELLDLLMTPQYIKKLALKRFCFHSPPAKENYVAWLGGKLSCVFNSVFCRAFTDLTMSANPNTNFSNDIVCISGRMTMFLRILALYFNYSF